MSIQKLHSLVRQFNTHELTLIRYALKGAKDESGENKYLRLFEYLINEHQTISRKAASMAIYHAIPDTRITKLAERLQEKILDIIISETFLKRAVRLSDFRLTRLKVRKLTLQAATLYSLNGTSNNFTYLIEQGIEEALKSGMHLSLVELYQLLRSGDVFKNDIKLYYEYTKKIEFYKKCYDCSEEVIHYYLEIIMYDGVGNVENRGKKIRKTKKMVDRIKGKWKYMQSIYSRYMFSLICTEYYLLKEDYKNAKYVLTKQIEELKTNLLAKSGQMDILENELAGVEIFLGNYEIAIKQGEKLLQSFKDNSILNYYNYLVEFFQIVFYSKKFKYAEEILDQVISDQNPIQSQFRKAKPLFFRACIQFQKKEFRETIFFINKTTPLNKDKTGYDIAIRVLRILSLLELEREDEAATQVENLRKHISRNYKKAYVSERDKMIIRVLQQITHRGFSGKPNMTELGMIQKLSHDKGNVKWMPKTPELIRFHEWYADWQSRKSKGLLN